MRLDSIRVMRPDEFGLVRALQLAAFGGDESIGRLLDLLRESWCWDEHLSFVAERGDEIVGHVVYTHALLDAPDRLVEVLVLSPVGVHPDVQGTGIGSRLIEESLDRIRERTEPAVFLEGDPGYYRRFGFRPGGELGFIKPSDRIPDPAFQAVLLPAHESWMTGRLVYPDAFWRADAVGLR